LRVRRVRWAAVGALVIGVPAAATAPLLAVAAQAQTAPQIQLADASLRYGQAAVVRGAAGRDHAGRAVALEYGSAAGTWSVIATATADAAGRYEFHPRLTRSGTLRVALGDASTVRAASTSPSATELARSAQRPVAVAARIAARRRGLDVLAGGRGVVRGVLSPGGAGRLVRLELRRGTSWRALAADRTDAAGRFAIRYRAGRPGSGAVRLTFPGDRANARSVRRLGTLSAYRPALASRYDLYGGALACGGSLRYDSLVVAHRSLPCGTRVHLRYRGRTVTATVRDRGPFSGGREFDLAGAVARRLGFDGVGTVWVAIG
jgi:hypothetical protein